MQGPADPNNPSRVALVSLAGSSVPLREEEEEG